MNAMAVAQPNADQIEGWNNAQGRSWAMLHERLDRQIAPIGLAAMAKAGFRPGEQVLDVGCGCGESTLEIARRLSPGGDVLGVDISAMLLGIARETAAAQDAANVRFIQTDAQTTAWETGLDVVFSRFGVMFFDDPPAAFANLRRALKSGGRLAFCCWRTPAENPWLALPLQATQHLLPPLPRGDPTAPGPFAFQDSERVRGILTAAGFANIVIEPLDLRTGSESLDDTTFTTMRIGQLGSALRQLGPSDALKSQVAAALRNALATHVEDGVVKLATATWIVSARSPG
jgi:SAM-dependent methyltransferase